MNFSEGRLDDILFEKDVSSGKIEFHPDGSRVAIPIFSKNNPSLNGIYIFDILNGKLQCILPNDYNGASLIGLAFSTNGKILASTHRDGTIVLRDSNIGTTILELKSENYDAYYGWISFDQNDSFIATSGYWQPVRVWDTKSGQLVQEVATSNIEFTVSHATISPDGNYLAFVNMGKEHSQVQIISIPTNKIQVVLKDSGDERYFLYSNNGNFIYSLNGVSEVTVWNAITGEKLKTLNPYTKQCSNQCNWEVETRISLSKDSSRLLLEDPSKVILWDTQTWQELFNGRNTDTYEYAPIVDASINPNGNMISINYNYTAIHFLYLTP